jgi:hypothetical protein
MGKKRFSRYDFALKATEGNTTAGTALDRYKKYKSGEEVPSYIRSEDSKPGGLKEVWVIPFLGVEDTDLYRATMSNRSSDEMGTIAGASTLFNHKTPGVGDSTISTPKFQAAKIIIRVSGTGETNETSKVTGIVYKKETDSKSYSYPFGRNTGAISANNSILGVFNSIKTAATALDTNKENTYSLKPEIFK